MNDLASRLELVAQQTGEPVDRVIRRYLLHGVLGRWARSAWSDAFVLRGGLMTQFWVGPVRRSTRDLDLLGLFPLDAELTTGRLQDVLQESVGDDGLVYHLDTLRAEVIWRETAFPGLRFRLDVGLFGDEHDLQIDIGFGDPLVPPAVWIDYPGLLGPPLRLQGIRPELMTAWKLDGLFDHGIRRWQAKDLFDLYLLTEHQDLDPALLTQSIRVAFEAHDDSLEDLPALFDPAWWSSDKSFQKWAKFRTFCGVPVPEDLPALAARVGRALRPALSPLVRLPDDESCLRIVREP